MPGRGPVAEVMRYAPEASPGVPHGALGHLVDPQRALAAHAACTLPARRVSGCLTADPDEENDRPNPPGQRGYVSYNARLAAMRQYMRERRAQARLRV